MMPQKSNVELGLALDKFKMASAVFFSDGLEVVLDIA
jgi:hypothetical protein